MKFKIKNYFNKLFCIVQRIRYKLIFYGMNIDPWHLSGTFYCREYKIKTLEIINLIKKVDDAGIYQMAKDFHNSLKNSQAKAESTSEDSNY